MIHIRALNEVGSSEDDYDSSLSNNQQLYNTETQEENLQAIYGEYLRLSAKHQSEDAKRCLLRLFGLIKDLDEEQASPVQKNLKYLAYKNLGDLFTDKIEFYIEALSIDGSDLNLWIRTARRAYADLNDYVLARNCLEHAFSLNARNWLVVDLLIDCYYVLYDYENCARLCRHALRLDAGYAKSHVLLHELQRTNGKLLSSADSTVPVDKRLASGEAGEKILRKLNEMRSKRSTQVEQDRLKCSETERSRCLELKVNLKTDTLNRLGVSLIKLYSELKQKDLSMETRVRIVKLNELTEQANSLAGATNEESSVQSNSQNNNSEDAKAKQSTNQNSSLRQDETSQNNSQNNSQNKPAANFPFEYVDKRRSTRVQSIQNKNTKDLDEAALLERITSLFGELVGDVVDANGEKAAPGNRNNNNESQTAGKNKLPVDSLAERECFAQFVRQLDQLPARPTVLDVFRLFVHYTATELKRLPLPSVYNDLYAIYRHHSPLPDSSISFLQSDQPATAEFWAILAANETRFDIREVSLLTELLVFLETALDEQAFLTFLIKLFILRGINETNLEFLEVARSKLDQLRQPIYNVNNEEITPQLIKALICSQSINNLQRLFEEQKYEQLFELLTPELALSENDLKIICRAIVDSKNFERGVEIFANRESLSTVCFDTLLLCYRRLSRPLPINAKLVRRLLAMARTQATVQSWTGLLAVLMAAPADQVREEHILRFIELSHQFLGNKARCNAHSGEYLLLVLDYLINRATDDLDDIVWRCFNCLYGFTKKNYAAAFKPHCNTHVRLSFENCLLLYNYVQPDELPEFDTANKSNTVSSEIRDLLLQIVDLIPSAFHPRAFIGTLDEYLTDGKALPTARNFQPHQITQNIFYLLADYYFKNKEFDKAMTYYRLDVCASHHRFDSWAAIALILTSAVEEQILNDTADYYDADTIYAKSVQAIRCFSNALRLDRANTKIWIEFGNFVYNIGSYSSKMKKTVLYFDLHQQEKPRTAVEELDKRIEEMFQHAEYCFRSSLKTDCEEEMWLHYYVLGKIAEKQNALRALHYYDLADKWLYLTGASYPEKINYYNPRHLSVEALEIHYRIHACALKSLLSGKNPKIKALTKTKTFLLAALRSPFVKRSERDRSADGHRFAKNEHAEGIFNCLSDVIDMTVERVEEREAEIKMTIINLCIFGLKRCLIRFQNHYRSYYRLAHYYFVIGNFQASRSVLLNSFEDIDILTGTKTPIPGLFQDRKSNNFFNGIWRIPVDDVERPGSFSNHMYKCILLLIQVCTGQGDYNFLISNLVINLHRTPDVNKKYLRDCERLGLTKKAFDNARILMLQQLFIQTNPEAKRAKFIEISQALDRLTKTNVFVSKTKELLLQCTRHVQQSCAVLQQF